MMYMIENTIIDIVNKVTNNNYGYENIEQKPFYEKMNLDSFEIIAILCEIENTFNFKFDNNHFCIETLSDIRELAEYIEGNISW